ncbi:hypothetical protein [Castellaniella sp.]|uniref:hypothetical protein n=1 Tax=Castellaniella sp. TaxID=1955812 RepID=UPI00355F9826
MDTCHNGQGTALVGFEQMLGAVWRGKWFLLVCMMLGLACAGVFLGLAVARYRAQAVVVPASAVDLSAYNLALQRLDRIVHEPDTAQPPHNWLEFIVSAFAEGRGNDTNVMSEVLNWKELTPAASFEIFLRHLHSQEVRDQLFESIVRPTGGTPLSESEKARVRQGLYSNLSFADHVRRGVPRVDVTLSYPDPVLAASWVNQLVEIALERSHAEMLAVLQGLRHNEVELNAQQIALLRKAAEYRDAAGAQGDPSRLAVLQARADLLEAMDPQPAGDLARVSFRASVPAAPYFPRRNVTLAVGAIAGLVLGFLCILGWVSCGSLRRMRKQV